MGYNRTGNEVELEFLEGLSIDCSDELTAFIASAYLWEAHFIVEKTCDKSVGSPGLGLGAVPEIRVANAFMNDTIEVSLESLGIGFVGCDGLVSLGFIDQYSS